MWKYSAFQKNIGELWFPDNIMFGFVLQLSHRPKKGHFDPIPLKALPF